MNTKTLRNITGVTLTIITAIGLVIGMLTIPSLFTDKWKATVTQSSSMSPAVFSGSLVISTPIKVTDADESQLSVFGVNTKAPKIGRILEVNQKDDNYFITAYGSERDPSDIFTYSTSQTVNKVIFSVPVIGYILTPLMTIPGIIIFVTLMLALILFYRFGMFSRKPKIITVETTADSIDVLQQIWDETPAKLTRKEKRAQKKAAQKLAEAEKV